MNDVSKEAFEALEAYRKIEREGYASCDLAWFDHMAEDFVLISNGVPTVLGRDAMKDFFVSVWEKFSTRFVEVVDDQVVESGDFIFVCGHFTAELSPRDGSEKTVDKGRYHGVFRRDEHGNYKLWREACTDGGPVKN